MPNPRNPFGYLRSMTETWKSVVGYEGVYDVSDMGRIRSLTRMVRRGRGSTVISGRILRIQKSSDGRPIIMLYSDGKHRTLLVHKVVAQAHIGERPAGMECCHGDGDNTNNAVSNLRYDTHAANEADKVSHGTHNRGERHWVGKLSTIQVRSILADVRTQKAIADEHGISRGMVGHIKRGLAWAWMDNTAAPTC